VRRTIVSGQQLPAGKIIAPQSIMKLCSSGDFFGALGGTGWALQATDFSHTINLAFKQTGAGI
jgi:hypothetical protein